MFFDFAMLSYLCLLSLAAGVICWRATRDRREDLRPAIFAIGANLSDLSDQAWRTGASRARFDEVVSLARTHYVAAMEAYFADEERRTRASVAAAEKCILRAWYMVSDYGD